jgi:hypothetical protein
MRQALRFTARCRNSGMPAEEGLGGSFESRLGGGKPWLAFHIAWQSGIQFHGRLTNAGFAYPENY